MDEQVLRKIVREEIEVAVRASEARLAENSRVMFRQLTDIYRSTLEKVEHAEKAPGRPDRADPWGDRSAPGIARAPGFPIR